VEDTLEQKEGEEGEIVDYYLHERVIECMQTKKEIY